MCCWKEARANTPPPPPPLRGQRMLCFLARATTNANFAQEHVTLFRLADRLYVLFHSTSSTSLSDFVVLLTTFETLPRTNFPPMLTGCLATCTSLRRRPARPTSGLGNRVHGGRTEGCLLWLVDSLAPKVRHGRVVFNYFYSHFIPDDRSAGRSTLDRTRARGRRKKARVWRNAAQVDPCHFVARIRTSLSRRRTRADRVCCRANVGDTQNEPMCSRVYRLTETTVP